VNADLQTSPTGGEVRVNFYKSAVEDPIELGTLFATQQSIRICQSVPGIQRYTGSCQFPPGEQIHVAAANGHFHGRGKTLEMFSWDGLSIDDPPAEDMFYLSDDWNEPPMAIGLDAVVPSGGGVFWACSYEWQQPSSGCDLVNERDHDQQGDCCYTFGNSATNAEHCNVFVYYWPKVESDVVCF
jgi:hypothetical protein